MKVVNITLGVTFALVVIILAVGQVRSANAPYVTLWSNGGPVSTANPLPAQNI
jgi:hypothetical protein